MPTTESIDYDSFDYKNFDEKLLSLEEAIKKAAELKRTDKGSFHKVTPVDLSNNSFRISSLSREEVYSDWTSRLHSTYSRILARARARSSK